LMVTEFGALRAVDSLEKQIELGVTGNGYAWNIIPDPLGSTDVAYIYQNTESSFSGVHRFKITGLDSVNILEIGIKK